MSKHLTQLTILNIKNFFLFVIIKIVRMNLNFKVLFKNWKNELKIMYINNCKSISQTSLIKKNYSENI